MSTTENFSTNCCYLFEFFEMLQTNVAEIIRSSNIVAHIRIEPISFIFTGRLAIHCAILMIPIYDFKQKNHSLKQKN